MGEVEYFDQKVETASRDETVVSSLRNWRPY
jgi:hypothetical protein